MEASEHYYSIPEYDDTCFDFVISVVDEDDDDVDNVGKFQIQDGYGSDYELEGSFDTKEEAIEVIKEFVSNELKYQENHERDASLVARIRKRIRKQNFSTFEGRRD